jgi:hypothetical protein
MISQYWVGQIPQRPLTLIVRDSDGVNINLSEYNDIKIKILGSYNEELDVSSGTLNSNNANIGKIIYNWPTSKSLFDYPGDYLVQLELSGTGKKDFTSTHTLRVREFGMSYR